MEITIKATNEATGQEVKINAGTLENADAITSLLEDGQFSIYIKFSDGTSLSFAGRNVWADIAESKKEMGWHVLKS